MAATKDSTATGFYKRGKIWWFRRVRGGVRVRVSSRQERIEDAREWLASRPDLTERMAIPIPNFVNPYHAEPFVFTDKWMRYSLSRIGARPRKGQKMSLDQLKAIVARADGRCEVTGIPFSHTKLTGAIRKPFIPSIDRIDCAVHYQANNCRLVCLAVNVALNQWGDRVFDMIALGRCFQKLQMLGHANHATT